MPDQSSPKVSIIMPTYNRSDIISRAIISVLLQTYENWELIIVDDGSTDPTDDVVSSFMKLDPRIKYFKMEQNSGNPSIPRNLGISQSSGEIITYLDSDDEYSIQKIEFSVKVLLENPHAGMVCCARARYGFYPDPEIWSGCPVDIDSAMHFKHVFNLIPEMFTVGKDGTNWKPDGTWFEEDQDLFSKICSRVGPLVSFDYVGVHIYINHKSRVINRQVSHV